VMDLPGARSAAQALAVGAPDAAAPDLLVIFQASFADSTMAVELARTVHAPVLLWAVPEERTGGRLRLNSFCGINLGGHGLRRAGFHYDYLYAAPGDPRAVEKVLALARAGRAARLLRGARIGRFGVNPDGFEPCTFDGEALTALTGVQIVQRRLDEVFGPAQATAEIATGPLLASLAERVDGLNDLDQAALHKSLGAYVTLRRLAEENGFAGLAVRCWPEFSDLYGIGVCHLLGVLTGHECPAACEGDVYGAVAMQLGEIFSGEKTFFADLVIFDEKDDTGIFWHCGAAPACLCKPGSKPCIRKHPVIDGGGKKGVAVEFPLKPGHVTVCRIGENLEGNLRLMVFSAEGIETEQCIRSTPLKVKFERPVRGLIDDLIYNGFEHHYVVCYGDVKKQLKEFARLTNLELIEF